jgi:uncharacterized membrane protein
MATENKALMTQARAQLLRNWGPCVIVTGVTIVLTAVPGAIRGFGAIVGLIIGGPIALGVAIFYLQLVRQKKAPSVNLMFDGFRQFGNSLVAYLLMVLFVVLWAILLIVPGIMAGLGYAMTFYIMADNPNMKGMDALKKSKEMMMGNRWKLFCLGCRFIGWILLGILSVGIGFLWIAPYMQTSVTNFYLDLKGESATQVQPAPAV